MPPLPGFMGFALTVFPAGSGFNLSYERKGRSEMTYSSYKKAMKPARSRLLVGLCLTLLMLMGVTAASAAPKRMPTAKPGDCAACHGKQKVLPGDHKDTKGMTYQNCLECHENTGPASLRGKLPSAHAHLLAGVSCQ